MDGLRPQNPNAIYNKYLYNENQPTVPPSVITFSRDVGEACGIREFFLQG